jgi:hypothetical protein
LILSKTSSEDFFAFTETLPVASDIDGDGDFAFIKEFPRLTFRPQTPEKIHVVAPSIYQEGRAFGLKVAILDLYNNVANDYTGTVEFISSDKKAILPEPYTFSKDEGGIKIFPVILNTPGYHTVTVYDKNRDHKTKSNPIACKEQSPENQIWWGDIHSHSEMSRDATGNGSFKYARDVAGLDFFSLTEHSSGPKDRGQGITDKEWSFIKQKIIEFYDPGGFVTILGYECSMCPPSGHHNVYFNASNELIPQIPIIRGVEAKSNILTLWKELEQKIPDGVDVITIPHHTGPGWKDKKTLVSYDKPYQNPKMRTTIEISSSHTSSEKYDPLDPYFKTSKKKSGPFAQSAWAKKLKLGVIAASDNHCAHPGMPIVMKIENKFKIWHGSLAAVYAKELTRDSIFSAIKSRNTYGTTGERIILNFTLNDKPMGSEVSLPKGEKPKLFVSARGTDIIDFIEILKWDFNKGKFDKKGYPIFENILHRKVGALQVDLELEDKSFESFSMYYLKLRQFPKINDFEVWAWSSPIWVKKADGK